MYRFNVFCLLLLLTACHVGTDYTRPAVTVPATFKEGDKYWKKAQPLDNYDRGAWWQIFNDPELNALELQLNLSNQTIAQAKAKYDQARALVDQARAAYFPTVSASAALMRQKTNTSASGSTSATASTNLSTTHAFLLDASWEPDIWGGTYRSVTSAKAGAQAAAAELALTRLSTQASLAQSYFELRALDADQKLLDQAVTDNQKLLTLTKNLYKSGVASLADIVQAESQLQSAQAQAINNGISRAQYEHAIAVLTGKPPAAVTLLPAPLTAKPPQIPAQIPSVLLERRPDIAQAERQTAQANAQIGVAMSAFYPNLTLSASGGFQGIGMSQWFSLPTLVWSVGPALAETFFDGGLRIAVTKAARANYEATVANYRQTVLSAFQEVEDNLVALRILNAQSIVQDKAADNARLALKLVIDQYKSGTVAYSAVLTAQLAAVTAEKNAADINGLRMTTAVALIKALGGGWEASTLNQA